MVNNRGQGYTTLAFFFAPLSVQSFFKKEDELGPLSF
jgi:hypothetical protein